MQAVGVQGPGKIRAGANRASPRHLQSAISPTASDALDLPGRRASEAVDEIALWRVAGTCAICAGAEIAGGLHTQCLHGTLVQLQPLSGQCMGAVLHAWFASAGTFTTFDRAPVACRIVARLLLACPV